MRGRQCVWLLMALSLWVNGGEAPDWDWKTVRTEENRFVVNGLIPADVQDLALWMEQTLRRMGREFGVRVVFNPFRPLVVILHPDAEDVFLHQQGGGRRLEQEIQAPEGELFDGLQFAEAFVEAILSRFLDQQQVEEGEMKEVPRWLVRGLAAEFVPQHRGETLVRGMERWQEGTLNPPYSLTGRSGIEGSGGGSVEDEMWAVRFLFAVVSNREAVWTEIQREGGLSPAWWREVLGATSLRETHLAWELWMAERGRHLMSEPAAGRLFHQQLVRELVFTPGRFGLDGEDVPRDERMTLPDVAERLDEIWVPRLLQAWRSRISILRFGQRADRLQRMDLYLNAAEILLEAVGLRGTRREDALERFRELYDMATEMAPEVLPTS